MSDTTTLRIPLSPPLTVGTYTIAATTYTSWFSLVPTPNCPMQYSLRADTSGTSWTLTNVANMPSSGADITIDQNNVGGWNMYIFQEATFYPSNTAFNFKHVRIEICDLVVLNTTTTATVPEIFYTVGTGTQTSTHNINTWFNVPNPACAFSITKATEGVNFTPYTGTTWNLDASGFITVDTSVAVQAT